MGSAKPAEHSERDLSRPHRRSSPNPDQAGSEEGGASCAPSGAIAKLAIGRTDNLSF